MTPVCIFGIGSPFGDDRLGWEAIEMLKQQPAISQLIPQVMRLETCDRPALRLLHQLNQAKIAILIDAIKSETTLGTLQVFSSEAIFNLNPAFSTHGLGISESLNLGKTLGILPEVTVLYGIEINEITLTSELSSIIKTTLKKFVNLLTLIKWQELVAMESKEELFNLLNLYVNMK
ncbi:MAG TPA: hydrogenase maturation protease [Gammaproteobacteria bacterium]|nr:hydrogenase maturation protease [Gammaproteobacteria bacterium]